MPPRTIREATFGKRKLRLVRQGDVYVGKVFGDGGFTIQGADAEEVWQRLQREAGKADPAYFGHDGARAAFLRHFPDGFAGERFRTGERDYKVAARQKLCDGAPLEQALTGSGLGDVAAAAFRATNLLPTRFEQARAQELMRGAQAALKPAGCASWAYATYLPFLWKPETHMILKPEITRDFARRVGHPFAEVYSPRMEWSVYAALLDLAAETETALADLGPRDRIDIQSFIWVVGKYGPAGDPAAG